MYVGDELRTWWWSHVLLRSWRCCPSTLCFHRFPLCHHLFHWIHCLLWSSCAHSQQETKRRFICHKYSRIELHTLVSADVWLARECALYCGLVLTCFLCCWFALLEPSLTESLDSSQQSSSAASSKGVRGSSTRSRGWGWRAAHCWWRWSSHSRRSCVETVTYMN